MVPAHSSVRAHLATETALLAALHARSRAQHRAQLFLRRLEGVLRLARLVIRQYAVCSEPISASGSGSVTPTPTAPGLAMAPGADASGNTKGAGGEGEDERLRELVQRVSPRGKV